MASHRHDARGRDEPYVFCYFFGYRLALPPGARALRLPDDARLRLLAASVCRGAGEAVPAMDLIVSPGGGD
jgi:alpha-mannosidase